MSMQHVAPALSTPVRVDLVLVGLFSLACSRWPVLVGLFSLACSRWPVLVGPFSLACSRWHAQPLPPDGAAAVPTRTGSRSEWDRLLASATCRIPAHDAASAWAATLCWADAESCPATPSRACSP